MHGALPDAPVILTRGPLGLTSGAESTLAEREGSEGEDIEERPGCPLGPGMGARRLQPFTWRWHWTQRSPSLRLWRARWAHITSQPLEGGSWGAKSPTGKRGSQLSKLVKPTPGWQRGKDHVAALGGRSGKDSLWAVISPSRARLPPGPGAPLVLPAPLHIPARARSQGCGNRQVSREPDWLVPRGTERTCDRSGKNRKIWSPRRCGQSVGLRPLRLI